MTWGEFRVDESVEGGVLELTGGENNSGRVYAGPNRLDGRHSLGIVEVRADGTTRAAVLYGKPRLTGGVALYGLKGDPRGRVPAAFAVLECVDTSNPRERWGRLKLSALLEDAEAPEDAEAVSTVEVDAGNGLGGIRIFDARRPDESFAVLEVDEAGPQLYLFGGGRHIRISPAGIEQSPDKAVAEPAREEVEIGDVQGPLGLGVEIPGPQALPELNFVAAHPDDPALEIFYNVLEGPEVAVYVRGTARLRAGRAVSPLPDHFRHVASPDGMTVQLTSRSAESKGVAATRLTLEQLEITELGGGTGEYDVDFLVYAIRKGREQYRVVRPKRELRWRSPRVGASASDGDVLDGE